MKAVDLLVVEGDIAAYVTTLLKTHNAEVRRLIQDWFVGPRTQVSTFIRAVNEAITTSPTEKTLELVETAATEFFGTEADDKGITDKVRVITYLFLGVRGRDSVPASAAAPLMFPKGNSAMASLAAAAKQTRRDGIAEQPCKQFPLEEVTSSCKISRRFVSLNHDSSAHLRSLRICMRRLRIRCVVYACCVHHFEYA